METITGTTSGIVELSCDEALKTEDLELIVEFCEEDQIPAPLAEATEEARAQIEEDAQEAAQTVESTTGVKAPIGGGDDGGSGGDDGGSDGGSSPESSPTGILPSSGSDGSNDKSGSKTGSRQVRNQGEQPRGISAGGPGGSRDGNALRGGYGGPAYSGMQSNSSLTLQPFAAPLVSVPPVYELPQVAQQLFGLDDAATSGDPMVAMAGDATSTSAFSGAAGTPDASGWMAATATGLIMLLGAAHALNGARTPKRKRA